MKKIKLIIKLAFISALMSVLLAGCGQSGFGANPGENSGNDNSFIGDDFSTPPPYSKKDQLQGMSTNKRKGTIHSIEVISAAENSAHIYRLEYPYNYYTYETSRLSYDEDGIIPVEKDLENIIPIEDLTEEDTAYLLDYVNSLSENKSDKEGDSDQDYLRHITNISSGMEFYIGRSADLPNMHTWVPTENHSEIYCTLHLDAHMEGMTQQTDFYYNADKKFILSDPNSDRLDPTDEILTFIELKLH